MGAIIQAALSLRHPQPAPCPAPPTLNSADPQRLSMKIFTLRNSKHSLWAHSCWIIEDYLLSLHRRKRLSSAVTPKDTPRGAVPEEGQWHQTTHGAQEGLACPASSCRPCHRACFTFQTFPAHRDTDGFPVPSQQRCCCSVTTKSLFAAPGAIWTVSDPGNTTFPGKKN